MAEMMDSTPLGARPDGRCAKQRYRSSSHSQGLMDGLLALREGGILFDVVLLVEGKPIEAHRILLAASCDYFRSAQCKHSALRVVVLLRVNTPGFCTYAHVNPEVAYSSI